MILNLAAALLSTLLPQIELTGFKCLRSVTLSMVSTYGYLSDDIQAIFVFISSRSSCPMFCSLEVSSEVLCDPKTRKALCSKSVRGICEQLEDALLQTSAPYTSPISMTFAIGRASRLVWPRIVSALQDAFPRLHRNGMLQVTYNECKSSIDVIHFAQDVSSH